MSPQGKTEQLTSSQISTVFSATNFVKQIPVVVLPGDYDGNDVVDAADYTVWRNTMNQTGSSLAADGNKNGRVDDDDYSIWKANFGRSGGTGSVIPAVTAVTVATPEPATAAILVFLFAGLLVVRRT